jgi:hypothetical protein
MIVVLLDVGLCDELRPYPIGEGGGVVVTKQKKNCNRQYN